MTELEAAETWVYSQLSGSLTLTGLLPRRPTNNAYAIYADVIAEHQTLPAVVFQLFDGQSEHWQMREVGMTEFPLLLKVVDEGASKSRAQQILAAADAVLNGISGSAGGYQLDCIRNGPVNAPEQDGGKRFVQIGYMYRLIVRPA